MASNSGKSTMKLLAEATAAGAQAAADRGEISQKLAQEFIDRAKKTK